MEKFYSTYRGPIAAILFFIIAGGVYTLSSINVELFPNITFPKIKIIAEHGEQPIDKMLVTVTVPLEEAIKKVEDLKLIRSTTSRGSCEIAAFLDWNADVDLGKQRIEGRIQAIKEQLPADMSITIEKMNPSILPVMGFSLEGNGYSQIELRQIAEYIVKPFLSRIDGISEIAVTGGKVKEYQVLLDPARMSRLGVTGQMVADALAKTDFVESSGFLQDYHRLYLTLTDASLKSKRDIEECVIENTAKRMLRLKDIGDIVIAERRDYIKINANGKNVPLVAVLKQPQANLIEVVASVEKNLPGLGTLLPKGVSLRPYYNQADFVNDSILSLRDVLWIGLLLGMIVTMVFLRSMRASLALLTTIPITLGLTVIALSLLKYSFNIMTIGAIAASIGLIIDDAIIVVEQIHRLHEEHPGQPGIDLVSKAIGYLFPSMVGSSLSTIVIFIPFVLMSGVAGAYFKVMTSTMIIVLSSSFLSTWIGLPVIYLLIAERDGGTIQMPKDPPSRTWVYYVIRRPAISLGFIVFLVLVSVLVLPRLESGFLPEMDEGSIVLDFDSPPGTSLEETDKMLERVDQILSATPEVVTFSRRTGTQMGFFITEPSRGDYLIQLAKKRDRNIAEVSDDIRTRVEAVVPSLRVDFGQVVSDMLGDLMSSVQPIEVKIFGEDHAVLSAIADSIAAVIGEVPGTADVFNGITIAGPAITIRPAAERLAQFQISPQDFHFQMQLKMDGVAAGRVLEKNRQVPITLFEKGSDRSVAGIRKSSLLLPLAKMVPMEECATVEATKGTAEIDRENLKPMIAVTARLNNRDLGSTLADIRAAIARDVHLPAGYQIVYGGAYAEQQHAFRELMTILLLASFLVFVVILFLFRKIKIALIIIVLSLLGLTGSVLALLVTGTPLNVGSYIGMIMIVGIIGENAIFTYQQFRDAKQGGKHIDDAIVFAISTRLRPKLMTALGAITALLPLAFALGTGAQMHQPLAIAIIGGLVAALPLLLIVFPSLLRLFDKS
ncbi:MAG: efflux RND transporter permease subunit [Ignavibacteriales bacterium]|nr:efflux RND transporter permease subunit [Ignavibacteriales bacterium]